MPPTYRRLSLWLQGAFHDLLREGDAIQFRIPSRSVTSQNSRLAHTIANLMMEGKVSRAIRLLSQESKGGILSLDTPVNRDDPTTDIVCDVLAKKHPPPGPVHPDSILLDHTPPPDHDPHFVVFDSIDGELICRTTLRTSGAACTALASRVYIL